MGADRSEDAPVRAADEARAVLVETLRQWATYWRYSAVLAWRAVAPVRKDTQ